MASTSVRGGAPRLGRRNVLLSAALAGLGAMIAVDVAGSSTMSSASGPLTDELKLRHLLRRAGFGASPTELDQYRQLGLSGAVDRLVNFEPVDNSALDQRLSAV